MPGSPELAMPRHDHAQSGALAFERIAQQAGAQSELPGAFGGPPAEPACGVVIRRKSLSAGPVADAGPEDCGFSSCRRTLPGTCSR